MDKQLVIQLKFEDGSSYNQKEISHEQFNRVMQDWAERYGKDMTNPYQSAYDALLENWE